jgi:hypothetical protein
LKAQIFTSSWASLVSVDRRLVEENGLSITLSMLENPRVTEELGRAFEPPPAPWTPGQHFHFGDPICLFAFALRNQQTSMSLHRAVENCHVLTTKI